jgi:hypothetical protein
LYEPFGNLLTVLLHNARTSSRKDSKDNHAKLSRQNATIGGAESGELVHDNSAVELDLVQGLLRQTTEQEALVREVCIVRVSVRKFLGLRLVFSTLRISHTHTPYRSSCFLSISLSFYIVLPVSSLSLSRSTRTRTHHATYAIISKYSMLHDCAHTHTHTLHNSA